MADKFITNAMTDTRYRDTCVDAQLKRLRDANSDRLYLVGKAYNTHGNLLPEMNSIWESAHKEADPD